MVIVQAFEEWRAKLESVKSLIQVLSDHKNLEYLISNKKTQQATSMLGRIPFLFQFSNHIPVMEEKCEARRFEKTILRSP